MDCGERLETGFVFFCVLSFNEFVICSGIISSYQMK